MRRLSLRAVAAFTVPALFSGPAALAQYAGTDDVPAAIALFSDENFYGDIRDVYDPFATLVDLSFNDRTRSIAVFAGQWELCEHRDFTGRCVFITEDVSDLGWFGLAGKLTSVRPVYEYTEASHGLMFSRDKYGYIRYAHNESYGYDTWNYGYASSWGISVSHYGYSPDYYRYGYYSPTWGYDPYGFAWGPRGTIRYTTSYRRHPRPSVINPYWSGWDRRPSDWRHGHWSWRDGRNGDNWRDWPRGGRDGRDRDGWDGRGRDGRGDRDDRDGRGGRDGDGRDGRGGDGRGDRPPGRDVPGDRWGPGAGGSGSVPTDPRGGRDGRGDRDGRDGDGRGGRDGRDGRGGGSWSPGTETGTTTGTPPAVIPRDPRPGRDTRGDGGGRRPGAGGGTSIVTPPADVPRDSRPGRDTRGGRGGDTGALLGGPGADGRGADRPRDTGGDRRGGSRFGDGGRPGGDFGAGRGSPRSTPSVSSPPPPPPPPPPRETRRETRSDPPPRVDRPRGGGDGARRGEGRRDQD